MVIGRNALNRNKLWCRMFASVFCRRWQFVLLYAVAVIAVHNVLTVTYITQHFPFASPLNFSSNRSLSVDSKNNENQVPISDGSTASKLPPIDQKEREKLFYSRRTTRVNPFRYNIRRAPSDICSTNDVGMMITVHSHPSFLNRRESIRTTWGSAIQTGHWPTYGDWPAIQSCCGRIKLVFVVGLDQNNSAVNDAIEQEFLTHGDIVQGDFIDDYHNMTLKSLLDLKFVNDFCPNVTYLLKSDDDMIINFPLLMDLLSMKIEKPGLRRAIVGPYNGNSRVQREGVWKLTTEEFPFAKFPPYESGSAYVITGDLIRELFETAEYVPPIFIDDVYITGILGRILGVNHVRMRGFAYWGNSRPKACDLIRRRVITGTKFTPQRLAQLWENLRNTDC